MILLQSIIVYGLMIWVMTHFGKVAYKAQYPQGIGGVDMYQNKNVPFSSLVTKSYYLIPIFVFCFFAAVRYRVGVDSISYKAYFYEILNYGRLLEANTEYGFIALSKFTSVFTDSHYLLFFILAFLQISFLYYAVRKKNYATTYLGLAIIFGGTYLTLMNGVRQSIAACVLVGLIPLALEKKKWLWFIIATFITMNMHKSAIIFLPVGVLSFFLLKKGILNVYLQLLIIAICFLMMDKIELSFIDTLFAYGEQAGYDADRIDAYLELEHTEKRFGLWSGVLLFIQLLIIKYCKKLQKMVKDDTFNVMYNLFFIGVCISLIFYNNFTIGRLNYYFKLFQPILLSTMLFYLINSKKTTDRRIFYFTIAIMFLNYILLLYRATSSIGNESTLYKFDFLN